MYIGIQGGLEEGFILCQCHGDQFKCCWAGDNGSDESHNTIWKPDTDTMSQNTIFGGEVGAIEMIAFLQGVEGIIEYSQLPFEHFTKCDSLAEFLLTERAEHIQ